MPGCYLFAKGLKGAQGIAGSDFPPLPARAGVVCVLRNAAGNCDANVKSPLAAKARSCIVDRVSVTEGIISKISSNVERGMFPRKIRDFVLRSFHLLGLDLIYNSEQFLFMKVCR